MAVGMLLEMAAAGCADRVLVGSRTTGMTGEQLARAAAGGAAEIRRRGPGHVAFLGVNGPAVPVAVLAACLAGVPLTPLNYRLAPEALRELLGRLDAPYVIGDTACLRALDPVPGAVARVESAYWPELAVGTEPGELPLVDDDSTAVMLFTAAPRRSPRVCCCVTRTWCPT